MLLHRYHNIEFILQMDAGPALELIRKAREKDRDERIFQQWVAQLPVMAFSGEFTSFADYKDRVTGANIDLRPTAEINKDLDEVERLLAEGGSE